MSSDPHHLERFLEAQANAYTQALAELRAGRKRTHWIWFIFPQVAGLGHSPTAQYFAIRSLDEARAYIEHPILGPRLRDCTELVNRIESATIHEIFASPDDMKFRSSMTLFAHLPHTQPIFAAALDAHFRGQPDSLTLNILQTGNSPR